MVCRDDDGHPSLIVFEIVVVPFAIQRQVSSIACRDKYGHLFPLSKDSTSVDQGYWSFPCYRKTRESDSMRRPSRLSIFVTFKAPRILLMHLMSFMLFLFIGFTDWAIGLSGGISTQTKLVSYRGQLSYPNFVRGQLLVNIWTLVNQIEMLNTHCHGIRKVSWCFERRSAKKAQNGVELINLGGCT